MWKTADRMSHIVPDMAAANCVLITAIAVTDPAVKALPALNPN